MTTAHTNNPTLSNIPTTRYWPVRSVLSPKAVLKYSQIRNNFLRYSRTTLLANKQVFIRTRRVSVPPPTRFRRRPSLKQLGLVLVWGLFNLCEPLFKPIRAALGFVWDCITSDTTAKLRSNLDYSWKTWLHLLKPIRRPGVAGIVNSRAAIYRTFAHLRRSRRIGFLSTNLFTEVPVLLRALNMTLQLLEETGVGGVGYPESPKNHERNAKQTPLSIIRVTTMRAEWEEALYDWRDFQKLSHIFHADDVDYLTPSGRDVVIMNYYSFTIAFPAVKESWMRFGMSAWMDFFRATPMLSRRVLRTRARALPFINWFVGNIRTFWLPRYQDLSFSSFAHSLRTLGLRVLLAVDNLDRDINIRLPKFVISLFFWAYARYDDWIVWVKEQRYIPTQPKPRILRNFISIFAGKKITTRVSWRIRARTRSVSRRRQWYTRFRYTRRRRHKWTVRRAKHMYINLRIRTRTWADRVEFSFYKRIFTFLWRRYRWRAWVAYRGKYRFYWMAKPSRYYQRQKYPKLQTLFDNPPPNPWVLLTDMAEYPSSFYYYIGVPPYHRFWFSRSIFALQQFRWTEADVELPPVVLTASTDSIVRWCVTRYRAFGPTGYSQILNVYIPDASRRLYCTSPGRLTFSLVGTLSAQVFKFSAAQRLITENYSKFLREWQWGRNRTHPLFRLRKVYNVLEEFFRPPYRSLRRYRQRNRYGRSAIRKSMYGRTNNLNMSEKFPTVSYRFAWYRPRGALWYNSRHTEEPVWPTNIYRGRRKNGRRLGRRGFLHTAANYYLGGEWLRWQLTGSKGAHRWRRRSGTQNVMFRAYRHSRQWNFSLAFWAYNRRIRPARRQLFTGFTRVSNIDKYRSFLTVNYFRPVLKYRQRHEWGFSGRQPNRSLLKNKPLRQRNAAQGLFKVPGQNIFVFRNWYKSGFRRNHKFRFLENAPRGRTRKS